MLRNLFFIQGGKIAVFKMRDDGEIESLKKEGNIFFKLEQNFWDWWIRAVDYTQGDELDFCFIWDEKHGCIFEHELSKTHAKKSAWSKESIISVIGIAQEVTACHFRVFDSNGSVLEDRTTFKKNSLCGLYELHTDTNAVPRESISSAPKASYMGAMQEALMEIAEREKAERKETFTIKEQHTSESSKKRVIMGDSALNTEETNK